jgi:hypothetical protein
MVWEDLAVGAGVLPLFHSFCTGVILEENGRRVAGVVVDSKAGLARIMARQVIDASGDADVCHLAGAPYEKAGDLEAAQSLTTTFRLANVDTELAGRVKKAELHALMKEANESGLFHLPREEGSIHPTPIEGVMHSNMTRMDGYEPTDPLSLTQAEIEGRRQTREYVRFLQECVPGYAGARLVWLSTQIGIRETRRVYGDYRLTIEDVMGARKFRDTVGQCGAPVEDHHGGRDTKWVYIPDSGVYDIPFRTLIPQGLDNVLVAGRCFSATHEAHASCRSMAQTMTMGQAAGVAAALCVQHGASPRTLDVQTLQEHLLRMGAVLDESQHVPLEESSSKSGAGVR